MTNQTPPQAQPQAVLSSAELGPGLHSEALLHAAKCRSWAAKAFNDTPDAALCVEAGDRLLYAAQLLDAQAMEINRLRAGMGSLIRERRGAESIREGLQLLMRGGPNPN